MPNEALDLAFARHVRQIGLVTAEQVTAAMQLQAKSLQDGRPLSLPEALVAAGLLTPTQRDALEKKVKDQQAGVQQLGPYKLGKKLGEGGMGAVYLAKHPAEGRDVAVKVLPRHLGANAEFVKRFKREAEAATRLKHPNIVGAFAAGEDLGFHYYVMEYCEGEPLDSLLKREGRLPSARAMQIVLQAAQGLRYAHQQGIIHRDIKPSNIFITKDGTSKILDLGLSKRVDDVSQSFQTVTGAVLGTPHYISPEQAQGEKGIDGRTDLYSLGATFYHLLTGKTPFDGTTVLEILAKHVHTQLPNPQDLCEDIPDPVVHVLQRMMAKAPSDRYHDCGTLIIDLEETLAGKSPKTQLIDAARTTIAPSQKRAAPKLRPSTVRRTVATKAPGAGRWIAIGAVGLVALAGLVMLALPSRPEAPAKPAPLVRKSDAPALEHAKPPPPPRIETAPVKEPPKPSPAGDPVQALLAQLKRLNPDFDGKGTAVHDNGDLTELKISGLGISDLTPLASLKRLRKLDVSGIWDEIEKWEKLSPLKDLRPLRGLPLSSLILHHSSISDLSPLQGMRLDELNLTRTLVSDLSVIRGMPLKVLWVSYSEISDLNPLRSMPLSSLDIRSIKTRDYTPIGELPLEELLADLEPLRDLPLISKLTKLRVLNGAPPSLFLEATAASRSTITPDAAFKNAMSLLPLVDPARDAVAGQWTRETGGGLAAINYAGAATLALPYLPPEEYDIRLSFTSSGEVPDVNLVLSRSGRLFQWLMGAVNNTVFGFGLSPLSVTRPNGCLTRGRRHVTIVQIRRNSITAFFDGEPLIHMSSGLESLGLMRELSFPDGPQLGLVAYKNPVLFHSLEVIEVTGRGTQTRKSVAGPASAPAPIPADWKKAIELLPLVELDKDIVTGTWTKQGAELKSDAGERMALAFPYRPPEEYDYRIEFTRQNGKCETGQHLVWNGRTFRWYMGTEDNTLSGFSQIAGKGPEANPSGRPLRLPDGKRIVSIVQVRKTGVTAWMDGQEFGRWTPALGDFTPLPDWMQMRGQFLGILSCAAPTTFHRASVLEIRGKGLQGRSGSTPPDPAFFRSVSGKSAEAQLQLVLGKLEELNPGFDRTTVKSKVEDGAVVDLEFSTTRTPDLWPLKAFTGLRRLYLGASSGVGVLKDISFLQGMKLRDLHINNTLVSDLSPLKGMPLDLLDAGATRIVSLEPLRGLPLNQLMIHWSRVKDLSPLRGSKITFLMIGGAPVADLAPLRDLPLTYLQCDQIPATDFSPLKNIKSLQRINDGTAEQFLKSR